MERFLVSQKCPRHFGFFGREPQQYAHLLRQEIVLPCFEVARPAQEEGDGAAQPPQSLGQPGDLVGTPFRCPLGEQRLEGRRQFLGGNPLGPQQHRGRGAVNMSGDTAAGRVDRHFVGPPRHPQEHGGAGRGIDQAAGVVNRHVPGAFEGEDDGIR